MKKAFSIISILLLTFGLFMSGYAIRYPAYADDNFTPLRQQSDMVVAFQEYCKSRDLTIEGSVADGVTSFTTGTFNALCNTLGINVTQLQAEIKAEYDSSGKPLKFLFTATGIDAYNRIFAQFLQDNELQVGDEANEENNTLFDGRWFVDYDGNGCLVYKLASDKSILEEGSTYKFNINDMQPNGGTYNFNLTSIQSYTQGVYRVDFSGDNNYRLSTATGGGGFILFQRHSPGIVNYNFGRFVVASYPNGDLHLGCVYYSADYNTDVTEDISNAHYGNFTTIENGNSNNCIIYLTTFNTVINNNNYEGDTIINNYPDNPDNPDNPDPDPEYPDPPQYDPDYPNDPITPQTPPDDWGIELPDFTDFDWIMSGLEKKFPWDIPFNIMFMLSLFVAEPEAPHFVGDIDLKVCNWHYDLDLEPFEPLADIFRKFFFIGFLLGLMLLTKQLIWG